MAGRFAFVWISDKRLEAWKPATFLMGLPH
jgi:hypothetical protein